MTLHRTPPDWDEDEGIPKASADAFWQEVIDLSNLLFDLAENESLRLGRFEDFMQRHFPTFKARPEWVRRLWLLADGEAIRHAAELVERLVVKVEEVPNER